MRLLQRLALSQKQLAIKSASVTARSINRIDSLRKNPRGEGAIKLSGQERYRVRQGAYRILYEIQDTELLVFVVKIAHRSEVYKSR